LTRQGRPSRQRPRAGSRWRVLVCRSSGGRRGPTIFPCPAAPVAARRSVLVATTQSREDRPGTACAFRTGHAPRVCATTVAHQSRPPVEPVLSRTVEVPPEDLSRLPGPGRRARRPRDELHSFVCTTALCSRHGRDATRGHIEWRRNRRRAANFRHARHPDAASGHDPRDRMHCTGNCAAVLGAISRCRVNPG
jgi:hypothetical protein